MKTLLLISSLILSFPLFAQEAEKLSPVERLLRLTEFEQSVIDGGEASFGLVEQSLAGENLNEKEMAKVKASFLAYMEIVARDPKLRAKAKENYEQTFTEDEILDLIAFYQTPTGKKTIYSLPAIMQNLFTLSQEIAQAHVAVFQEELVEIIQEKNDRLQKEEKK